MSPPAAAPRRVEAIDVARAAAIIGVVANHSIDGMFTAGVVPPGHALDSVNSALYIFRMPALAFLLGLFVPRAVAKRGRVGYVVERASLMLYLYLLWFILQNLAETATNGLKNTPRSTEDLWAVWQPFAHLWFLPFLVVTAVTLALLEPWRGTVRRVCAGGGLLAVALLTWGWNPDFFGLTGLSLIVFAAAGSMVGLPRLGRLMQRSLLRWWVTGAAATAVFLLLLGPDLVPSTLPVQADAGQRILSLTAAATGTVVLLALSVVVSRIPAFRTLLAAVGRRTLPIYLAHVIIVAGVRVALVEAGSDDPVLILTAALVMGVALPIGAAVLAERWWWAAWIFDLPAPLKRRLLGEPGTRPSLAAREPQRQGDRVPERLPQSRGPARGGRSGVRSS
jgi:fucose 4-O-acetylase-like acetyltransferase